MISVAAQSGLVDQVGNWVLQRALRDHRRWADRYPDFLLQLSVNISSTQLMGRGFRDSVTSALDRTQTDPAALTLEMTEDIFIDDSERAETVLSDLKALGVQVALDDFGTGYSSLSYLRSFPVDTLKIDRAFLIESDDPDDTLMLKAITDMGHALRLTVTAEGMETRYQRDLVATVGCDHSQGFFYAIPMAADGISQLLEGAADHRTYLPVKGPPPRHEDGGKQEDQQSVRPTRQSGGGQRTTFTPGTADPPARRRLRGKPPAAAVNITAAKGDRSSEAPSAG